VQRADILGNRTFAMRIWLKPEEMAARGVAPSDVHDALAKNNYLSALGSTKGSMVSVNLIANTDLRTPDEFKQMVVKRENGVVVRLGEIADVALGAENYDQDVRFNGETATFMGVWVLPTANSLEVIRNVRQALPAIQAQLPAGMKLGVPYDSTEYIQDASHRRSGHLPIPGLVPFRVDPGHRDSDFADRSCVSHAPGRLHDQPAYAAGHCAFGRLGRGRRHRHG
jgi:multidrug efflux pump